MGEKGGAAAAVAAITAKAKLAGLPEESLLPIGPTPLGCRPSRPNIHPVPCGHHTTARVERPIIPTSCLDRQRWMAAP